MWSFEDELKDWFERVKENRNSRFGGGDDDDDSDSGGGSVMMKNEFARGRG